MKKQYFINANIIDPHNSINENGGLIIGEDGKIEAIEIDTRLADDINKSVIKEQVELGVAVRMACLKIFCE